MKSIKYFLNKLSCINTEKQNTQSKVDQYLIKEYKRLRLLEEQAFKEHQEKLLEEQHQEKLLEEKLLEEQHQEKLLEEKLLEEQHQEKLLEEKLLEEQHQEKLLEEKLLEEQKVIINTVFLQYKEQYKEFYSTHHSPIHSHFNKTDFVELCNTMNFNNEIELIDKLNDYNNKKRKDTKAYKNLSTKRRVKCDVFNFYLFI